MMKNAQGLFALPLNNFSFFRNIEFVDKTTFGSKKCPDRYLFLGKVPCGLITKLQ